MNTSNTDQIEFPILKGCPKTFIKSTWLKVLILAGCFIPPILGYASSGPNHVMPNSQAALFLVPMSLSFVLLPFTGITRKAIYAKPLLTMLIAFWPLAVYGAIEKLRNPHLEINKVVFFPTFLWIIDLTLSWLLLLSSLLVLMMTIIFMSK